MPKQWADLRLQARELSIYKVSRALGLEIHDAHGDCPRCQHQGLLGSLSLWDCEGRFRCWSCHQSGDSLELVQFVLGCNATAAWNWLKAHGFLQESQRIAPMQPGGASPKTTISYPINALELASRVFQKTLPPLSAAMEAWFFKRGIPRSTLEQLSLRSAPHPTRLYEILGESLKSEELKQLGMEDFAHQGRDSHFIKGPQWSEGRALVLPIVDGEDWKSFEIWFVQGTRIHLWQHSVVGPFYWEYMPQKTPENRIWLVGSFADALVYIKRQLPVGIWDSRGKEQNFKTWIQDRAVYVQAADWRLSEDFLQLLLDQMTQCKLSFHLES